MSDLDERGVVVMVVVVVDAVQMVRVVGHDNGHDVGWLDVG